MFTKRSKNAEKFSRMIVGLLTKSFADGEGAGAEPPTNTDPAPQDLTSTDKGSGNQINYEELIARARQEEKNKLYPQIKSLKDDLKEMTQQNNKNLLEVGRLQKELEKIQNGGDSEEVANLKSKIAELEGQITTLKEQTPDEQAIREQIEQEYEVKLYRTEQLAKDDVKKDILPMFMDSVKGATKEEIDAAIEQAKTLTQQAKEQMGVKENNIPAPNNTNKPTHSSVPNSNPQNPINTFGGTNLEDVRNLDPASPEYAEWRKKMGLR